MKKIVSVLLLGAVLTGCCYDRCHHRHHRHHCHTVKSCCDTPVMVHESCGK